jgi:ribonuclease HI
MIQSIYTDGACSGNPGPGGWGVVVYLSNGKRHELGGREAQTTNNRMEMQAAIAALQFYQDSRQTEPIELYTDSEYVKNGITKWVKGWKQKGWKTAAGKPVLNQDLWQQLDQLNSNRVQWRYVRGHTGNAGNERCDEIARAYTRGQRANLVQQWHQISSASVSETVVQPEGQQMPLASGSDAAPQLDGKRSDAKLLDRELSDPKLPDTELPIVPLGTAGSATTAIQSEVVSSELPLLATPMADVQPSSLPSAGGESSGVPRELRVAHLRDIVETLQIADEIAQKQYLITSSELADLMDVNASAVTSRGDNWVWRNWVVSRVRREGNQILWQLERVD